MYKKFDSVEVPDTAKDGVYIVEIKNGEATIWEVPDGNESE